MTSALKETAGIAISVALLFRVYHVFDYPRNSFPVVVVSGDCIVAVADSVVDKGVPMRV